MAPKPLRNLSRLPSIIADLRLQRVVLQGWAFIIKQGKKRALTEVVDLETTSACQATPLTIANASSRLKKVCFVPSEPSHLLNDFLLDALPFSFWSPGFPVQQKGDKLLKSSFDHDMFDTAGVMGMFQWIQMASFCSCTIARHLEFKEHSGEKTISERKKELIKWGSLMPRRFAFCKGRLTKPRTSARLRKNNGRLKRRNSKIRSLLGEKIQEVWGLLYHWSGWIQRHARGQDLVCWRP